LFRRIKDELGCDDQPAAMLALAQSLTWVNVSLQVSDGGYPERLGNNIADAIDAVTKNGSISVRVEGEMMNSVSTEKTAKPPRRKK
jgi:hypothetical protein